MSPTAYLTTLKEKRKALEFRAEVVEAVRSFFRGQGYLEVETPILVPTVAPEEHIVAFRCDAGFLATSPELQMKLLEAAGFGKIYQVTRAFRNREIGSRHNPEFTILEWYRPADRLECLKQDLEDLFTYVACKLDLGNCLEVHGHKVSIEPPWLSVSIRQAFVQLTGYDPLENYDRDLFQTLLVDRVEPGLAELDKPVFVHSYPIGEASLAASECVNGHTTALRAELYVGGVELANGFFELRDPVEQEKRFQRAKIAIENQGGKSPPMPNRFIEALRYMPPCVGMALGIDRLVMLLYGAAEIGEVMAFPWGENIL